MFVERNTPSSVSKRERHNLQTVVILILRNIHTHTHTHTIKEREVKAFLSTVDIF